MADGAVRAHGRPNPLQFVMGPELVWGIHALSDRASAPRCWSLAGRGERAAIRATGRQSVDVTSALLMSGIEQMVAPEWVERRYGYVHLLHPR